MQFFPPKQSPDFMNNTYAGAQQYKLSTIEADKQNARLKLCFKALKGHIFPI